MKKLNLGTVYTNDYCVACNRCITSCPIIGANVFVIKDGKTTMTVNADKCIHCGRCVKACNHGARKYHDDSERFIDDLKKGKEIGILISPAFFYLYGNEAPEILGYLQSLGAKHIYDVGLGAEISVWAHLNYIINHKDDENRAFIGQSCSSVVSYLEHHDPEMLKYLIPVQSPFSCTVTYVRKYLKDNIPLAYIGPCVCKGNETGNSAGDVEYNITFSRIKQLLNDIDYSGHSFEFTCESEGFGRLIPMAGGFKEIMRPYFKRHDSVFSSTGIDETFSDSAFTGVCRKKVRPTFVEIVCCDGGCVTGPGVPLSV